MLITFYVQHTGVLKTARTQFLLALLSLIPMLLLGIVPILTGKINFANFFPLILKVQPVGLARSPLL